MLQKYCLKKILVHKSREILLHLTQRRDLKENYVKKLVYVWQLKELHNLLTGCFAMQKFGVLKGI